MPRSDLMKFWKLLDDSRFTGQPYKLTEADVRRMAMKCSWTERETEEALNGLREFLERKK